MLQDLVQRTRIKTDTKITRFYRNDHHAAVSVNKLIKWNDGICIGQSVKFCLHVRLHGDRHLTSRRGHRSAVVFTSKCEIPGRFP